MTTSTTVTPTQGSAILAMIESDLVSVGGAPLETLITNLRAHAGNAPLQAADILQFQAAAPGAGLQLGLQIETQLLTLALNKLQAFIQAKQSAPAGS